MSTSSTPHLIYGAAALAPSPETGSVDHIKETFKLLQDLGVTALDTAQIYGVSEATIGEANTSRDFTIGTKVAGGFMKGVLGLENIDNHGKQASKTLGPIDVYYIHAPNDSIPLEPQLDAIQSLYKEGIFKRFGLSNFPAEEVEKVYNYMKSKDYVLPTVYQGNYNAFSRIQETKTFPTLRKLGIVFYAYSPLAGGLLAKTRAQLETAGGRWDPTTMLGSMYRRMYEKEDLLQALTDWEEVAKKEGVTAAELGYRWIMHHSYLKGEYGDAVIFGANGDARIKETVAWLKAGPLSDEAVKGIDKIWEKIEHVAPHDNYQSGLA